MFNPKKFCKDHLSIITKLSRIEAENIIILILIAAILAKLLI